MKKPLFFVLFVFLPLTLFAQTPTLADLQAQIQTLLKQIQAIQALRAGTAVAPSSVSAVSFVTKEPKSVIMHTKEAMPWLTTVDGLAHTVQ